MKLKKAVLVANGPDCCSPETIGDVLATDTDETLFVAVDGGLNRIEKWRKDGRISAKADLWFGDSDSSIAPDASMCDVRTYSPDKDMSDLEIAIRGVKDEFDCKEIFMTGMLGGRLDHEFVNFELLRSLAKERLFERITVLCKDCRIFVFEGEMELDPANGDIITVISSAGIRISTKGMKYALSSSVLERPSHGLSNMITGKKAGVRADGGMILLLQLFDVKK